MSADVVIIRVGGMGQAMADRQSAGRKVLLADLNEATLAFAADQLRGQGHDVVTQSADASSRSSVAALSHTAQDLGPVTQVAHIAVSRPCRHPRPPS
ncbi:hypothetical protein [Streptomyces sp. NPDC059224]|uniref:hypothetical protein n=1 Tax=Streptomyces sp. NPDC059224 TaxID=3346775 RepID=UPI003699D97D